MARVYQECQDYYEILEAIEELYPEQQTLTPPQVAKVLGVDVRTVRTATQRRRNPMPTVAFTAARIKIPIHGLARWVASGGAR